MESEFNYEREGDKIFEDIMVALNHTKPEKIIIIGEANSKST